LSILWFTIVGKFSSRSKERSKLFLFYQDQPKSTLMKLFQLLPFVVALLAPVLAYATEEKASLSEPASVVTTYTVETSQEGHAAYIDQTAVAPDTTRYWNVTTADGSIQPLMSLDDAGRLAFFRFGDPDTPAILIDPNGATPAIWVGEQQVVLDHVANSGHSLTLQTQPMLATAAASGAFEAGGGAATGVNSIAIGYSAQATTDNSVTVGPWSRATGISTAAFGNDARATGDYSLAIGPWSRTPGRSAIAIGDGAQATLFASVAVGPWSQGVGNNSMALGNHAYVGKDQSIAVGFFANATEENSVVIGTRASAAYANAIAIGNQANASLSYSTAVGAWAQATGEASSAYGVNTQVPGHWASAFGNKAKALGVSSVAIGNQANAEKNQSIAIGTYANIADENSIAIGTRASAAYANAIAIGLYAEAAHFRQIALGAYNKVEPFTTLFMLGNGTSSTDRSNALTVTREGKMTLYHTGYTNPTDQNPTPSQPEALDVQGSARVRGELDVQGLARVRGTLYVQPAGDISMGGFTSQ
jgi:hypothetical protein